MKKESLIFATANRHKLQEVASVLGDRVALRTLTDCGITEDIAETADTLEGNALLKARYVYERTGCDCFADDTGLEVAALGGEPGVRSARYAAAAGESGHDNKANMALLLKNLEGATDRSARFRTVIALIYKGEEYLIEGQVAGHIIEVERGVEGFGYDPVFVPDGFKETFAEMSLEAKNKISHRGRATAALKEKLAELFRN